MCNIDGLSIVGDETNCPNVFGVSGCCDAVRLTSPSPYLDAIVADNSGSSDCTAVTGDESNVCTFMKNKANHDVFTSYPESFPYGDWLQVSVLIADGIESPMILSVFLLFILLELNLTNAHVS